MTEEKKGKKKGLIIFIIVALLAGTTTVLYFMLRETKIQQGELTYEVSYPYNDFTGITAAMLPKEVTVVFKGSKLLTIIQRGRIFKTEVFYDEETNDMEMRLDFGSDKFYTDMDDSQIDHFKNSQPAFTITETNETDSLAGLFAKKYIVKYPSDTVPEFESWFTEALSIQKATSISSYHPTVGMPLIYDIDRYGVRMHLEVTGFKEREVKDSEFDRDSSLEPMDYTKYEKKLQELFDILTKKI